jgi:hypothetical protein
MVSSASLCGEQPLGRNGCVMQITSHAPHIERVQRNERRERKDAKTHNERINDRHVALGVAGGEKQHHADHEHNPPEEARGKEARGNAKFSTTIPSPPLKGLRRPLEDEAQRRSTLLPRARDL